MRVYDIALVVRELDIPTMMDWLAKHGTGAHWMRLVLLSYVPTEALGNVHTLVLRGLEITDAGVACLRNVHTLDLQRTRISDLGLCHLGNVHKAKSM
jgi:hypothetical protein